MPKRRGNGGRGNGASRDPSVTLRRTFRYVEQVALNNSTGTGMDQTAYYGAYKYFKPESASGFRSAQTTFQFWRMRRCRAHVLLGYNPYNQTYNTSNLDGLMSTTVWTSVDPSTTEIANMTIMSYNNAKFTTPSLNGIKKIVDCIPKLNMDNPSPNVLLPGSTWIDTREDLSSTNFYSGFQLYITAPSFAATNYLPRFQIIYEMEVEFKLPAVQSRPTTFDLDFIGSKITVIPDASLPDDTREYEVATYTVNNSGNIIRLLRTDGVPGFITYSLQDFYDAIIAGTSGPLFGNRAFTYTGPSVTPQ